MRSWKECGLEREPKIIMETDSMESVSIIPCTSVLYSLMVGIIILVITVVIPICFMIPAPFSVVFNLIPVSVGLVTVLTMMANIPV
jgi:hypothetical protein